MPANIDLLPTQKSLIDLSELPKNSFNSIFYGFSLKQLLDDVMLVKFVDETDDGTNIALYYSTQSRYSYFHSPLFRFLVVYAATVLLSLITEQIPNIRCSLRKMPFLRVP